jgi:hypothetical protein
VYSGICYPEWDVIYFLDARKWLEDKFILYKIKLKKTSTEFSNLKINKKETYYEQCNQKRRPRLNWIDIYKQLSNHCEKVFDGKFEDIFV